MRRLLSLLLCTIICIAATYGAFAEDTFVIREDGFLEGTLDIDGTRFVLDAVFDYRVQKPMMNVKIVPSSITKAQMDAAINNHFTVSKGFELRHSLNGCFSYFTLEGNYSPGGELSVNEYHDIVPFIVDEVLSSETNKCKAFLDELGIAYYDIPAFAAYGTVLENSSWLPITQEEAASISKCPYAIKLALEIEGMPMMPNTVGNRGSLDGVRMDDVLSDMPYAFFNFSPDGELLELWLHTYAVLEKQEISASIISWQDALSIWWNEIAADETLADYFEDCEIRVIRMQMVWLANYRNVLRPGWYIEIQGHDKETGRPFWRDNYVLCATIGVDAVTGEIW